jgi:hypothetical protein
MLLLPLTNGIFEFEEKVFALIFFFETTKNEAKVDKHYALALKIQSVMAFFSLVVVGQLESALVSD